MPGQPTKGICGNFAGHDYTDEQREFLVAMDRLRIRLGHLPSPREVLREAIRLGYRKTEDITIKNAMDYLRGNHANRV